MRTLNMEPAKLYDIIDMQVDYWGKDFPQIKAMKNEIVEMLKVEEEKFEDTLKRGEGMVKRIASRTQSKRHRQTTHGYTHGTVRFTWAST